MTDTPPAPGPRRMSIAHAIKLVFGLQIVIAGFLIATDLNTRWRFDLTRSNPPATGPIAPGDQVRRYDPQRPIPQVTNPLNRPDIAVPDQMPSRLEFSIHDLPGTGPVLVAHGAISAGDDERFATYLDELTDMPAQVALYSPGGIVDVALSMGRMIREAELDTAILPGTFCLSSCPYMLAGGVNRQVSLSGAVGLHQHYYETPGYLPVFLAVSDIQRGQGATMAYLIDMGIDAGVMVHGLMTLPDDIYILVGDELQDSNLATELVD
jgi:hypothetical protein